MADALKLLPASLPPLGLLVSAAVAASDGARLLQTCAEAGRPAELLVHDRCRPPA